MFGLDFDVLSFDMFFGDLPNNQRYTCRFRRLGKQQCQNNKGMFRFVNQKIDHFSFHANLIFTPQIVFSVVSCRIFECIFSGKLGYNEIQHIRFLNAAISSNYLVFKHFTVKFHGVYALFKKKHKKSGFLKFEIDNFIMNLSKFVFINEKNKVK